MITWRLKKGSEKKFRTGHPWIFSSELAQSPKNLPAGAIVDLYEHGGAFLARGYGHPNSQISFRTLSRVRDLPIDQHFFFERFKRASAARRLSGVFPFSHRMVFAEGDFLPGLIVDRYRLVPGSIAGAPACAARQVFVMQSSTAGMDALAEVIYLALKDLVESESALTAGSGNGSLGQPSWDETVVVVANDSKSRLLENVAVQPKLIKKDVAGFNPSSALIAIQPPLAHLATTVFEVDLIAGQKTGFFLDQRHNVQLASSIATQVIASCQAEGRAVRVLDLCCYVGQWGAQLAQLATALGVVADVTLIDASSKALELAARNVERAGGRATPSKLDVLEQLKDLPKHGYDIVICDPPAFIKKKKDLPAGTAAYLKLNREALRRVAKQGLFVSCSCSGLLIEEEFRSMLAKATVMQENEVRWLLRGSHSADHPQRPEYPQGTYLKSWIGVVQ
jgi:23S rRNA (cytosine1962-C5)-methyltransferase